MMLPPLPGESSGQVRFGRIDYVAQLDGGMAVGIEAKVGAFKSSKFGDHLRQCHDYTRGVVAPQVLPQPAQSWQGRPLYAVFLACEMPPGVAVGAAYYARRIMSPFRVGFVSNHRWQGLHMSLGGEERWWSEKHSYRTDAFARVQKLGSGKREPGDTA